MFFVSKLFFSPCVFLVNEVFGVWCNESNPLAPSSQTLELI